MCFSWIYYDMLFMLFHHFTPPPNSHCQGLIPTGTSAHLILAHTGAGIQLRPIL